MNSEFWKFAQKVLEAARAGVAVERMRSERILSETSVKQKTMTAVTGK